MKVLLVCLMIACLSWAWNAKPKALRKRSLSCNCGWRNTGRIVGGKETRKNEYPWMVSISSGCGGSIITQYHVLTAAHCTAKDEPESVVVFVAMHNQYEIPGKGMMKMHRVSKIIQHKGFVMLNGTSPIHDISILVLATPIKFNQFVGPVCLSSSRLNLSGKFIKITGWGFTKGTGDQSVLREVDVQVVSNNICKRSWPLLDKRPTQLCNYTPKKDSCGGDSGGPLVYLDPATNRYTQVALVSYGAIECGNDPRPSVNTDVFAYNRWIKRAIASSHPRAKICTKV